MSQFRTVTLTDGLAIQILEAEWPVLARADGIGECSLMGKHTLRVRRHADGRTLVYAVRILDPVPGPEGQFIHRECDRRRRGEMLRGPVEPLQLVETLRRVASDCGLHHAVVIQCIANLPPVRV